MATLKVRWCVYLKVCLIYSRVLGTYAFDSEEPADDDDVTNSAECIIIANMHACLIVTTDGRPIYIRKCGNQLVDTYVGKAYGWLQYFALKVYFVTTNDQWTLN